jgi:hypothetical protein
MDFRFYFDSSLASVVTDVQAVKRIVIAVDADEQISSVQYERPFFSFAGADTHFGREELAGF